MKPVIRISKNHLDSVQESYWQHQRVAFNYGLECLKAAVAAFIHGVLPAWCETAASDRVKRLAQKGRTEYSHKDAA